MQIQLHLTGEMPPLMVVAVATTYVIQVLIQCWREAATTRSPRTSRSDSATTPRRSTGSMGYLLLFRIDWKNWPRLWNPLRIASQT